MVFDCIAPRRGTSWFQAPNPAADPCEDCTPQAGDGSTFGGGLFDTSGFPERWHCGTWPPALGYTHIVADLAIWLAYLSIPVVLVCFLRRRRDVPFPGLMLLFGAFILSCGTTHLCDALIFYWPAYRFLGLLKVITAVVSWATVVALVPVIPKALLLRSPRELEHEVERRTRELARSRAELEAAMARADEANRLKTEFLANMSHEIRTPLTAILGFSDVLEEQAVDDDTRRTASVVQRNGRHLLDLLNDVLDLSKIEAGKMELEATPYSPIAIARDVQDILGARARDAGLDLVVEIENAVPEKAIGDPLRVRQILINLVGNAIKFTCAGSVRLTLGFDEASGMLRIRVSDTGPGLDDDARRHVFDAFTQADTSVTRKHGGTGLGLTISRRLARLQGGDLTLESTAPSGSVFCLALPAGAVGDAPRVRELSPAATRESRSASDPALAGRRFLLAEDGPDNVRLLSHVLSREGVALTVAGDGAEAVRIAGEATARGEPFDLVIMDMQMPVLDGYEATRQLRAAGWQGPILALTAGAMASDRERAMAAGCDAFATKPFDRKKLCATLEALIQGR